MPKIMTMYAYISEDGPDDEGIVAVKMGGSKGDTWMPLVGADMERMESLRPMALAVARATGKKMILAYFQARTDYEVIRP